MECPAAVNIQGEHFNCDWPVDENGRHDGWSHTSAPAQAVWTEDRNAPLSPPEFSAPAEIEKLTRQRDDARDLVARSGYFQDDTDDLIGGTS
jgi:hypothetical protein